MATTLGKLVRSATLAPALPKRPSVLQEADRAARIDFLLVRGRQALAANATWRGAGREAVSTAGEAPLRLFLATELSTAVPKMARLTATMKDPTKTELVPLDDASVDPARRFRRRYMSILDQTPTQLRDTAIASTGWRLLARNLAISEADLHTLVSRRLMVTERMLWYVGTVGGRNWSIKGGKFEAGKEWADGWNRMFEYPRLPASRAFDRVCNSATGSSVCDTTGQMKGWSRTSVGGFAHTRKLNSVATPQWVKVVDARTTGFHFVKTGDPVKAINDLFKARPRFDERNFLLCDAVIHCLNLEALARVKARRDANAAWLKPTTDAEPEGWLRVSYPWRNDVRFLGNELEHRFFEHVEVPVEEITIGDHTIIYNHPAYDKAKDSNDVWRLENAVVVSTFRRTMLQGHGTNPLPFTAVRKVPVKGKQVLEPSMRLNMLGLFNAKLRQFRTAARAENRKAAPRTEIDEFDSQAKLVQRTDVGPHSGYDPSSFTTATRPLARWWIRWTQDGEQSEPTIAADPVWAKQTWDKHRVELTGGFGYFPLWLPRLDRAGNPVRKGGRFSALADVTVSQRMASGWTWYYAKDESPDDSARHRASVIRPKVS